MPIQINPSKIPIWKTETTLQLGTDGSAQALEQVTNQQERLINILFKGVAEDQLEGFGLDLGMTAIETTDLVARLKPSLLKNEQIAGGNQHWDARFAEIIRIAFDTGQIPEAILARRSNTIIHFPKIDRTSLLLIRGLAESGFRYFTTEDFDVVTRNDVGELGFNEGQLGISRIESVRMILAEHRSWATIEHVEKKSKLKQNFTIISSMHQVNPHDYRQLRVPHLAIEYGIDEIRISPLIKPGVNACLGCRDLWESENNPDWTSTAIQLAGRNDQLDDSAGLLMASAVAVRAVCAHQDDAQIQTGTVINLRSRAVKPYSWQPHPECRCRTKNR